MRWPSPTRSGPRSCAGWAPAVPTTSCARASRRSTCPGSRDGRPRRAQGSRSPSGWSPTARTTPSTTRPTPTRTSPALRDSNPSVVVVPGLGLFGFGKDKREARITSEFFVNAIHVMAGANALEDTGGKPGAGAAGAARRAGGGVQELPQLRRAAALARRSASSTGRSRRPSCSACRRSASSAARSSSSSAAPAASAAKSRCSSPSAARTSSSPI